MHVDRDDLARVVDLRQRGVRHGNVQQRHQHAAMARAMVVQQLGRQVHGHPRFAACGAFDADAQVVGERHMAVRTAARQLGAGQRRWLDQGLHAPALRLASAAAVKSRGPVSARPPSTGITAPVM